MIEMEGKFLEEYKAYLRKKIALLIKEQGEDKFFFNREIFKDSIDPVANEMIKEYYRTLAIDYFNRTINEILS